MNSSKVVGFSILHYTMADHEENADNEAQVAANNNEEEPPANIIANDRPRSIECVHRVYLRFVNHTNRCIELVWVNYNGAYERYTLLRRFSHYVDINTFQTHPWIALDQYTKDLMRIDRRPIYYPQQIMGVERPDPNNPNIRYPIQPQNRRQICVITLPLYSLRERCLLELRNHLSSTDDVVALHLPDRLGNDLRTLVAHRENMRTRPMVILN